MPPVKLKDARILLTNDDGYSSHGIQLLSDIVVLRIKSFGV